MFSRINSHHFIKDKVFSRKWWVQVGDFLGIVSFSIYSRKNKILSFLFSRNHWAIYGKEKTFEHNSKSLFFFVRHSLQTSIKILIFGPVLKFRYNSIISSYKMWDLLFRAENSKKEKRVVSVEISLIISSDLFTSWLQRNCLMIWNFHSI